MAERMPHGWAFEQESVSGAPVAHDETTAAAVGSLGRRIFAETRPVALIVPERAAAARALERLAEARGGARRVLRVSAGLLRPPELATELLEALREARQIQAPGERSAGSPADRERASAPIVMVLEDADTLLPETADWLAGLARREPDGLRLVFVGRDERLLGRSLRTRIRDLVWLEAPGSGEPGPSPHARPAGRDAEAPRTASFETRRGPNERGMASTEPVASAEPPESEALAAVIDLPARAMPPAAPTAPMAPERMGGGESSIAPSQRLESVGLEAAGRPSAAPVGSFGPAPPERLPVAFVLLFALLGVCTFLWLRVGALSAPASTRLGETMTRHERSLRSEPPALRPETGTAKTIGISSDPSPPIVSYDPMTKKLRLRAWGVPLREVLGLLAWQTGLRVETELELTEEIELEGAELTVAAALEALLAGHHALVLETAPTSGAETPRTVWILAERSPNDPVADAVEVLLTSEDPPLREEAAVVLERQGARGAAYDLIDRLARAEASGAAETAYLARVRDRLTDTLCRSWAAPTVGPQASALRCD